MANSWLENFSYDLRFGGEDVRLLLRAVRSGGAYGTESVKGGLKGGTRIWAGAGRQI